MNHFFNWDFNLLDNDLFFIFGPISFENFGNELKLPFRVFRTDKSFNSIFGFELDHHPPFPGLNSEMAYGSFKHLDSTK